MSGYFLWVLAIAGLFFFFFVGVGGGGGEEGHFQN